MASEDADQIAARIAQKLRDAGFGCKILDPAPTETALEPCSSATAYRRPCSHLADRGDVELLAVALGRYGHGWQGPDWIPDDSVRHGAHDAGAHAMAGDGVRIHIRYVDRDDDRHDDVLSDANDSYVRPCGPTRRGMGRFRGARHPSALGARA